MGTHSIDVESLGIVKLEEVILFGMVAADWPEHRVPSVLRQLMCFEELVSQQNRHPVLALVRPATRG